MQLMHPVKRMVSFIHSKGLKMIIIIITSRPVFGLPVHVLGLRVQLK